MSATTSRISHAGQFIAGLLISGLAAAVAAPLWVGVGIVLYFTTRGDARVGAAVVVLPIVLLVTYLAVRRNRTRALGAIAFYPLVVLPAYFLYVLAEANLDAEERKAMEREYSGRTIAQPLGTIDVLGIPQVRGWCWDTCARILLNGIAREVAAVSYDATVNFDTGLGYGKEGAPWVFRRFRLGRGSECLTKPDRNPTSGTLSWTGTDVQWIQSQGVFDVCIVGRVGNADLGNMVLIEGHDPTLHNERAKRPHGPAGGAMAAYRIADGQRSEIARWEFGTYPRSRKNVGTPFTTLDFVKALSGQGASDRLANPYAMTFREAVERIHASLDQMPDFHGRAPFEFLRKVHEEEQKSKERRASIDDDVASKLKAAAGIICRERSRDLSAGICINHYNGVIDAIFAPELAQALRLTE
jgi:hypothetical protein